MNIQPEYAPGCLGRRDVTRHDGRRRTTARRHCCHLIAAVRPQTRGGPCQTFTGDTYVATTGSNRRMPDMGIDYGKPDDNSLMADKPSLVVEVLSPTTGGFDVTIKLAEYQGLPSLDYILFVDTENPTIHLYRRDNGGLWQDEVLKGWMRWTSSRSRRFPCRLRNIYEGLEFRSKPKLVLTPGIPSGSPIGWLTGYVYRQQFDAWIAGGMDSEKWPHGRNLGEAAILELMRSLETEWRGDRKGIVLIDERCQKTKPRRRQRVAKPLDDACRPHPPADIPAAAQDVARYPIPSSEIVPGGVIGTCFARQRSARASARRIRSVRFQRFAEELGDVLYPAWWSLRIALPRRAGAARITCPRRKYKTNPAGDGRSHNPNFTQERNRTIANAKCVPWEMPRRRQSEPGAAGASFR